MQKQRNYGNSANSPFQLVINYFDCMDNLRDGDKGAVEDIMSLWDNDGCLILAGAPKAPGWPKRYKDCDSIAGRYSNLLEAQGKSFKLSDEKSMVSLSSIKERIRNISLKGNVATATVVASVSTNEDTSRGFEIEGNFTFTLNNGKIAQLIENVDWSDAVDSRIEKVKIGDLNIDDIGRLTLMAWAIA